MGECRSSPTGEPGVSIPDLVDFMPPGTGGLVRLTDEIMEAGIISTRCQPLCALRHRPSEKVHGHFRSEGTNRLFPKHGATSDHAVLRRRRGHRWTGGMLPVAGGLEVSARIVEAVPCTWVASPARDLNDLWMETGAS